MIGVSDAHIRHVRRVSTDPHGVEARRGVGQQNGAGGNNENGTDKHQLIDNMLANSPPLPAPPVMQAAQIMAQEREMEQQFAKLQTHTQQQRNGTAATTSTQPHRVSVTGGLAIDPAYTVVAPLPQSTAATAAKPKSTLASADWFTKVTVAPRPPPAAAPVPSSLSTAITDSGLLRRDDFSRLATRELRDSPKETKQLDTLIIWLHPYSDVLVRPARIRLQLPATPMAAQNSSSSTTASVSIASSHNPSTDDILSDLLSKWASGELRENFGLRAVLQPGAQSVAKWALKMIDEDTIESDIEEDDDEDDDMPGEGSAKMMSGVEVGMPEEDLPPLERNKPVRMFGVAAVAMVVAEGFQHKLPTESPNTSQPAAAAASSSTGPQISVNTSGQYNAPATPSSRNPASAASSTSASSSTTSVTSPQTPSNAKRPVGPTGPSAVTSPNITSPVPHAARKVSIFSAERPSIDNGSSTGPIEHMAPHHERQTSSQRTMSHDPTRLSIVGGGPYDPLSPTSSASNQKYYIKIHIGDHESHILGLLKTQLLADALPLLSAKKHALVSMKIDSYRFTYVDPLLRHLNDSIKDMSRVAVGSLASDELNLIAKGTGNDTAGGNTSTPSLLSEEQNVQTGASSSLLSSSSSETPSLSSFHFSLDTAGNYCEYKVIKTNQRGKRQHRIFGMDRFKIYNKMQNGAEESEGGMLSFFKGKVSGDQGVSRAYRNINTIASVHVVSLRPTCFCISFKSDARKDSPIAQSREYETETKMECAEVVAKLRFLMAHAVPDNNQ